MISNSTRQPIAGVIITSSKRAHNRPKCSIHKPLICNVLHLSYLEGLHHTTVPGHVIAIATTDFVLLPGIMREG